jgi:phosphatidylglycerol:prolipoprotein diacylglycerol transferase
MYPTLFEIGPVPIRSYGTLLMVGFVAAILLSRRQARRLGLSSELPLDLGLWVLVLGLIFARGVYVALNWTDFARQPVNILCVWREGGLSFHGGLLGGLLAGVLFSWRQKVSFWLLADMVAPGLALGYAIARLGCLLNGCCYGLPTEGKVTWGMRFLMWPDSQLTTQPSHPTQIYASLGSLVILAVLLAVHSRLKGRGQLFLLYLMLYAVMRAAVEILRKGVTARVLFDGITEAQLASAVIFALALVGFIIRGRQASGESAADGGEPPQ